MTNLLELTRDMKTAGLTVREAAAVLVLRSQEERKRLPPEWLFQLAEEVYEQKAAV